MAGSNRFHSYNLLGFAVWRVGSSGYSYGQLDPTATPTPDTTSPSYTVVGESITATLPEISRKRAEFGGSSYKGSAYMGIDTLGEATMENALVDSTLSSILMDGNIDTTTISTAKIASPNNNNPTPNEVGVCFWTSSHGGDDGSDGTLEYTTWVIPKCNASIQYTGGNLDDGKNPQTANITFATSLSGKFPWGAAFSSTQNWYENKTDYFYISGSYPYNVVAYVDDFSTGAFTAPYLPASSTVDGSIHVVTKDGASGTLSSFSTSTGAAAFTAAASGTIWNVWYAMNTSFTKSS